MKRFVLVLIGIFTIALIGFGFALKVESAEAETAQTPPPLSSTLPTKVTQEDVGGCSGSKIAACVQNFAWQTFFALNWPANSSGQPIGNNISDNPDAPRVWEFYPRTDKVFPSEGQQSNLSLSLDRKVPVSAMFSKSQTRSEMQLDSQNPILDPTQKPLVDQTHNYVLYDIRINPIEAQQIHDRGWYNINCLTKYNTNHPFQLPANDKVGYPMEIKTAWRILSYVDASTGNNIPVTDDSGQAVDKSAYYTVTQKVLIPKENIYPDNPTGNNSVDLDLGLIGFHISYKVPIENNNKDEAQWIWATFEQGNNTPSDPTNPETAKTYTLYNSLIPCDDNAGSDGSNCNTLQATTPYYFNTTRPPSAVTSEGKGQTPTQVVRLGNLSMTELVNKNPWEEQLEDTVWDNYQMRGVGVQWQKQENSNLLANSAIETYVPKTNQSCLKCHNLAKLPTDSMPLADFSYLFKFNAKDLGQCKM